MARGGTIRSRGPIPTRSHWQPVPQMSAWGEWTGTPLATNGNRQRLVARARSQLTPAQAKAGGTLNIGMIDDST